MRNINVTEVNTCVRLKSLIKAQFHQDIALSDFDVGYVVGANFISIRTEEDLGEILSNLLKGENIVLWCDGLSCGSSRKRKATDLDTDESEATKKTNDRDDRVQNILGDLKKEHGEKFTVMQYRIWSEMIAGGMHGSTVEPPATSRAGSSNTKKSPPTPVTPTSGSKSSGNSPARVIDNRSKCYNQLSELRNLKETGLLSDGEYAAERAAIMSTLKNLTP